MQSLQPAYLLQRTSTLTALICCRVSRTVSATSGLAASSGMASMAASALCASCTSSATDRPCSCFAAITGALLNGALTCGLRTHWGPRCLWLRQTPERAEDSRDFIRGGQHSCGGFCPLYWLFCNCDDLDATSSRRVRVQMNKGICCFNHYQFGSFILFVPNITRGWGTGFKVARRISPIAQPSPFIAAISRTLCAPASVCVLALAGGVCWQWHFSLDGCSSSCEALRLGQVRSRRPGCSVLLGSHLATSWRLW